MLIRKKLAIMWLVFLYAVIGVAAFALPGDWGRCFFFFFIFINSVILFLITETAIMEIKR